MAGGFQENSRGSENQAYRVQKGFSFAASALIIPA
jgi:hypothetical protein